MRKMICFFLLMVMLHVAPAFALENLSTYMTNPKPVGSGRMSVLMMDVYDATLFAPEGKWKQDNPMALQITYLREISGSKIADRSVVEMRNIGIRDEIKLATWHTQMRNIFPDVREGVSLTGILGSNGESIFLHNGREAGRIKDPEFGKAFFAIWLNEKTSAPQLRQRLLGAS